MKTIIPFLCGLVLVACSSTDPTETTTESPENSGSLVDVKLIDPCSIITEDVLKTVFNVSDPSTIEMYAREKSTNAKQCQFLWTESTSSVKSSQLMIDIMSNMKGQESPTAYSRMLEMDLLNGLLGQQQQLIKPSPIADFGPGAYYWAQLEQDNVQKIKFQINENYMVQVMYNSNFDTPETEVKKKLMKIGNQIKKGIK